ncbi:MAG: hypothetical protein ACT4ON_09005 [Bacteroidota bacterium]
MKHSKKAIKLSLEKLSRFCTLLFISFILSSTSVIAQDSASNSAQDTAAQNNGPSLQNIKKTGSAISEKIKADARRKEILGYVYMILGFSLVIAVAWFSTVKARKYKERQDEKKRKYLEAKIASQGGKTGHRDPHRRGHRR